MSMKEEFAILAEEGRIASTAVDELIRILGVDVSAEDRNRAINAGCETSSTHQAMCGYDDDEDDEEL